MLTDDKTDNYVRSRFDASHELGHLVMHEDVEPGTREVEGQAQDFASSFLMPEVIAREELPGRLDAAGWSRLAELKRRFRNAPDVNQIVVSDGLSAVSVFIEPAQGRSVPPALGASRQGAVHTSTRKLDHHLVTVVGDVPAECVQTIANGVAMRGPQ